LRVLANKSASGAIFFERLKLALSEVEADYRVVILDTPPSLGFLTVSAIYAATSLITTVHPAMLDACLDEPVSIDDGRLDKRPQRNRHVHHRKLT